ncbi:MAG: signal peptidase I [Anaerolinea sp.]
MMRKYLLTRRALLITALSLSALVFLWILLAPSRFGGAVEYVIVNGDSMEPLFHRGDLVLLRRAPFYEVGDIVVYRYPGIGAVIHRIVDRRLDRFVLKGDHNTWLDGYEPTQEEILGKYWLWFPGLGTIFLQLRSPWVLAILVGVGSLMWGLSFMQSKWTERRKKARARLDAAVVEARKATARFDTAILGAGKWLSGRQEGFLLVMYVVGILALVLGAFAFTRPVSLQVSDQMLYRQTGAYTYTGEVPPGVYDQNRVVSGGAIFPKVSCGIDLAFDYQLESQHPAQVSGTYQLMAVVNSTTGWRRTILLNEQPVAFSGKAFSGQASLDVCEVEKMIAQVQEVTGAQTFQYFLNIYPQVQVSGTLGGMALEDTFNEPLSFTVQPDQIYLNAPLKEGANPLQPVKEGALVRMKTVDNTLSLFTMDVPVRTARALSAVGLAVAALGIGMLLYLLQRAEGRDEKMLAKLAVGSRLVEVQDPLSQGSARVVHLPALSDLLRLAEQREEVVFFHYAAPVATYYVRDGEVLYVHRKLAPVAPEGVDESTRLELLRALENNEFALYFQPSVSLEDGRIAQLESFLRWRHPQRGLLTPGQFLPDVERAGMLMQVDLWVLRRACEYLAQWREAGLPLYPIAINLSVQSLVSEGFAAQAQAVAAALGVSPEWLYLEIPENGLDISPVGVENLRKLREAGFGIVLNASERLDLEALQAGEEIQQIKLGYPTVQKWSMGNQMEEQARQWISQAHQRKIRVAAVGVETSQQLGFFRLNACDQAQGYWISPPVAAEDLPAYLAQKQALVNLSPRSG